MRKSDKRYYIAHSFDVGWPDLASYNDLNIEKIKDYKHASYNICSVFSAVIGAVSSMPSFPTRIYHPCPGRDGLDPARNPKGGVHNVGV